MMDGKGYYDDFPTFPPYAAPVNFAMTLPGMVGRQLPSECPSFGKHVGKFFTEFMGGEAHLAAHGVTVLLEDRHFWYGDFCQRKSTAKHCKRVLLRHTSHDGAFDAAPTSAFEVAGYNEEGGRWVYQRAMRCIVTGPEFFRCLLDVTNVSLTPSIY